MNRHLALRWGKRLLVYLAGLFLMAVGVVFSVRSSLGVSPVTCLANVVHQITGQDLGICTTAVYCLYILAELLLLGRRFQPRMLLQIVASFLFGSLVSLATKLFVFLPVPELYPLRLLYLFISIPLVAMGVMLYLAPDILPTPGEGMSLAISIRTGLPVANSKTIFDCTMVVVSAVVSLVWFHGLVGVREGTVLSALLVGVVLKRLMLWFQPAVLRFVEREGKVARAVSATVPMDSHGKPKILITISREFGSGGYEIGRELAERLGIEFYDDEKLIPLEAEESGLAPDFIRGHERHLRHEVVYDFLTTAYTMTNQELSPLERLFAAQNAVIHRLAAGDSSGVIVGRCADYVLHNDPNSFRVFIHATPEERLRRVETQYGGGARDMEATDRARAWIYRRCTGRQWGDGRYYNLTVDSGKLGIAGSVSLLDEAIRLWCDARGVELTARVGK